MRPVLSVWRPQYKPQYEQAGDQSTEMLWLWSVCRALSQFSHHNERQDKDGRSPGQLVMDDDPMKGEHYVNGDPYQ